MDSISKTKLIYFQDMLILQSKTSFISQFQGEDNRYALILESTIFHPQGGGQPSDIGFISNEESGFKFIVDDVRLKDGLVAFSWTFVGYLHAKCGFRKFRANQRLPFL
ncbi:hypothetical protein MKX01_038725 [Papaver californicum]|nr:hypothetical protein MKX01_038725 [Papaver californicum]